MKSLLCLMLPFLIGLTATVEPVTYRISYDCTVSLKGETNVNQFACSVSEQHGSSLISITMANNTCEMQLTHPTLKVSVPDLDCGSRIMNHDLQQSLKADQYPYIRVKISEVTLPNVAAIGQLHQCLTGSANATIFLAEARQVVAIPIRAENLGNNRFRFVGEVPLWMSHFGVKPPSAMLGMIEVEDRITVLVDMKVLLLEVLPH